MSVTVLRLGHRPQRDKRLTTHVLLAARAFGASRAFYSGTRDVKMEEGIRKVVDDWGGDFAINYVENWRQVVRDWDGEVIHLTMYGLPVKDVVDRIRRRSDSKLVVVGGAKVPRDLYDMAGLNVGVTSQPHSEVSALAVFLHMFFNGQELLKEFEDAHLVINPSEHGKDVRSEQRLSQTGEV
jgi:tRNA (cytidine56-2'-O)-methyltransferase